MQLYFIRHGQSINNANVETKGYHEIPDPSLSEIGKQQVQILAQFLRERQTITQPDPWNNQNRYGFGITHIYTSLMVRATESAAPIARALGTVPLTAWADIHEEGGIYDHDENERFKGLPGKPRSYFEMNFPELKLPTSLDEAGWWNRPWEEEDERQPRADRVLTELLEKHGDKEGQPEDHIVFVSHGGFFVRFLCVVLQLPWRQGAHGLRSWFFLNNCSISRFDFREDYVTMVYLNNTNHLPSNLIKG